MDNKNVEHNVSLTEGEMSTILYYLDQVADDIGEAYIPSPEVESIYSKLEGVVDKYYETKVEKAGEKNNAVTPTINGISVNLANGALKDYYAKLTSGET
jgi:hypothetical protein